MVLSQKKTRVGWPDVAFAGTRTSVLVGPVDHGGEAHARAALGKVAARGPSARLGLVPSQTGNKWSFDPDRCAKVWTIDPLPFAEMLRVFERITADASVGGDTIVVVFCGDYLMMSADHGFGDATACLEVVAIASGADPEGYAVPNIDRPLTSALIKVVSSAPRAALQALREAPTIDPTGPTEERDYPPADVRDIVTTFVRSEPGMFDIIRRLRKESFPDVSMSAAVSFLIRRGFEEHGVRLTDDLGVLVDLRRFLPEGRTTLANLPGIAEFSAPASYTLEEYGSAYSTAVSTPAPLIRLAGSLLKKRIRRAGRSVEASTLYPNRARTVFSDPSLHPTMKRIRWSDRGDGFVCVLINDPGVPNQIPITTMWDGHGRLNITASYFSGSYDRAVIDAVLEDVATRPLEYLRSAVVT